MASRYTGGRECGGTKHMYLDLGVGPCTAGAVFYKRAAADHCPNESPGTKCFKL